MKDIPDFDIELAQATDYIMESPLAKKTFSRPPFLQYTNVLRILIQSVDRLADNCHMPEFTNHALPHICSIVRRASEWAVEDQWIEKISEEEAGYLLLALIVHDIGMLSQDASELPDENKNDYIKGFADISNWVRRTHVLRIQGLVMHLLKDEIREDPDLKVHIQVVIGMAASHQKWPWESGFLSHIDAVNKCGLNEEHIAALNAVIAVCDLLDEDSNRCDTITLIKYRHGTTENMAHWIRHALTVEVDGVRKHTVRVTFRKLIAAADSSKHRQPMPCEHRNEDASIADAKLEKIYRALRNHYRLVKLYNRQLAALGAEIEHMEFLPADGIPEYIDEVANELSEIWVKLPEFKDHITEQLLSTFMLEVLGQDNGNQDMRRRLDEIGLEMIDLSEEAKFLNPETVYYPEEKVLAAAGNFKKQLTYIKEMVEDAYLNGQIGKVRHLCFIAWKKWKDKVSLNDIYWIYVFLSINEKHGDEYYGLASGYENSFTPEWMKHSCDKLQVEGDYQYLLDVWFMLLKPSITEEMIQKYMAHIRKCDYQNVKDDLATVLLFESLTGMFWYYKPEREYWKLVSTYLIECLSRSNKALADKLQRYVSQLEMQGKILFRKEEEQLDIRYICDQPFAKAWIDFWNEDWKAVEADIPKLCKIANKDRDFMEPVQGYLNMVQWSIQLTRWRTEQSKKEEENAILFPNKDLDGIGYEAKMEPDGEPDITSNKVSGSIESENSVGISYEDEIDIGRYRYARIQLEQPLPSFWQQRNLVIESLVSICQDYEKTSGAERCRLLRLLSLQALDALRYWDLGRYLDVIRNETKLHYLLGSYIDQYGEYKGEPSHLTYCLIWYIRGISERELNEGERQIVAKYLMEYADNAEEELSVITEFIIKKTVRIQWKCALSVVEVLAKYFSIAQRKRLLHWLAEYHKYYKQQNRFFDMGQYQFLKEWTEKMEPEDWEVISELVDEIFTNQQFLMVNIKLAECIMQDAPWQRSIKYLEKMKEYPDNAKKSYDLFQAIITMSQRKDADKGFLHEIVLQLIQQLEQKIHDLLEVSENMARAAEVAGEKNAAEHSDEMMEDEVTVEQLNDMIDRYRKLDRLIDVDSLYELEPVDMDKIDQAINRMEVKIKARGNLSGYDSTFMYPVMEAFCNQNWSGALEEQVIRVIDRLFGIMQTYRLEMSEWFFYDFCRLLYLIGNSGAESERVHISRFVMENMVYKNFFAEQEKERENPLASVQLNIDSPNLYVIGVAYLLVGAVQEIAKEQQQDAIKYLIQAMKTDEPVIYNFGMIMFSYYFLLGDERIRLLSWGGMQFMSGRLNVRNGVIEKIQEKVKNAVTTLEQSTNLFGEKGFRGYVEEDEDYKRWFKELPCDI